MQHHRQARQIGKTELATHVHGAKRQHAWRQRCYPQPSHDGRSDRRNAAANKDFRPRYACRIQDLSSHHPHATRLCQRGKRQRLVGALLLVGRGKPAELLFSKNIPVAPPGIQPDDHSVEFAAVEALQQVA